MGRRREVGAAVTWGLLGAWVIHDAEELATMPAWVRRIRRRLPASAARHLDELDRAHFSVAVGLMGCLIAAAAADGARTGGRSRFFQAVLFGFGAHAVPHVLSAAVTRGYTPGLVTAPTVVAPFSWWAWRRLRSAGVVEQLPPTAALALVPASIAAAHLGAAGVLRAVTGGSRRRL